MTSQQPLEGLVKLVGRMIGKPTEENAMVSLPARFSYLQGTHPLSMEYLQQEGRWWLGQELYINVKLSYEIQPLSRGCTIEVIKPAGNPEDDAGAIVRVIDHQRKKEFTFAP